jgi:hypothetical protein
VWTRAGSAFPRAITLISSAALSSRFPALAFGADKDLMDVRTISLFVRCVAAA